MNRMALVIPFSQEYADEYEHYERTMDAICSRNPKRVKPNCLDMLRAKVLQLKNPMLFDDAMGAYMELKAEAEGATDD